jgi:phosphate uptake regulator
LELRKLQQTGDGTFFVTLPKSWVTRLGLQRGAVLGFTERKDRKLLIAPFGEFERKIDEVTLPLTPLIERDIEEKYLLGYDIIRLKSSEIIPSETRESVKRILKRLVGLEIVEEDAKGIVIQCLIEPSLLAPDKIIRRLHLITLAMQKDAIQSFVKGDIRLAASVVERDDEVDRLYFLLVRLVRAALTDPAVADKMGIAPIDCLDYRLLASFIETFADYSTRIAQNTSPEWKSNILQDGMKALEVAGEVVNLAYRDAVDAVLSRNLNLAANVSSLMREAEVSLRRIEKELASMPPILIGKATSVISAMKAMSEVSVDIADLAITR